MTEQERKEYERKADDLLRENKLNPETGTVCNSAPQSKCSHSHVVRPLVTRMPSKNQFLDMTLREIIQLMADVNFDGAAIICFFSIFLFGMTKHHLSQVLKKMGHSHTAIGNKVDSIKKILDVRNELAGVGRTEEQETDQAQLSASEEIKEIFDNKVQKNGYWWEED